MSRPFDVDSLLRPESRDDFKLQEQHSTSQVSFHDSEPLEQLYDDDDDDGRLVIDEPNTLGYQDSCIGSTSLEPVVGLEESREEDDSREDSFRIDSGLVDCGDFEEGTSGSEDEEELEHIRHKNILPLKVWIFRGSKVLARWSDGLYYEGIITNIDELSGHAEVMFEDTSKYWTDFKDLHKQLSGRSIMTDSDILCAICRDGKSSDENPIVLCDVCNQGYHKKCHKPKIPSSVIDTDDPWTCRLCVFALGTAAGGAEKPSTETGKQLKLVKDVLPYDLSSLDWDEDHRVNRQKKYCYCEGPGDFSRKMLQCRQCLQWFHEACLQCLDAPLLYGDHFFTFTCQVCGKGVESAKRIIMKWDDVIALVISNLHLKFGTKFFIVNKDIIPFLTSNAHLVKLEEDITKMKVNHLCSKVQSTLLQFPHKFKFDRKGWTLRTPLSSKLIFAPPHAVTSKKCPQILEPTALTPSMIFPYGACRKGASNFPIPMSSSSSNSKTNLSPKDHPSPKSTSISGSSTYSDNNSHINSPMGVMNGAKKRRPKIRHATCLEELIPFPPDLCGKDNPFRDQDDSISSSFKKVSKKKFPIKRKPRVTTSSTSKKKVKVNQERVDKKYRVVKKSPNGVTIKRV